MTSADHARRFFALRRRAYDALTASRLWKDAALRCAREKVQAERDAAALMEAAIRAGAEYVAARTRETDRGHARRLAEVCAWLDSAELEATEAATVARLAEEREGTTC